MDQEGQVTSPAAGVAIELSFPLGRYHATAAGTAVNEAEIEWPPSPWRLLRALVSVWKRRAPELSDPLVLGVLDILAEPCQYTLPPAVRAHTRHYLVGEKEGERTTFLTLDPFMSCMKRACVVASWPDAVLDDRQRDGLEQIASRLTYLGRAESFCDARLLRPDEDLPEPNTVPAGPGNAQMPSESIRLLVPDRPLNFEHLCVRLEDMRTDSRQRSINPPSTSWVSYQRPRPPLPTTSSRRKARPGPRPTAVRFRLASAGPGRRPVRPPLRDAVLYTAILRAACQSQFGRMHPEGPSSALSGRIGTDLVEGHPHAHYLALPAHQTGSGAGRFDRIESLAVWAPGGLTEEELRAVLAVRELRGHDWISEFRPARLVVEGFGPAGSTLGELVGPSRSFRSLTPFFPGHHPHSGGWTSQVEAEVRAALRERDLPEEGVVVQAEQEQRGYRTQRPSSGASRGRQRALNHPHSVQIRFSRPVAGPVCLGALSHFGLGLFLPME